MNTHTIEELLDVSFPMRPLPYQMKVDAAFPELFHFKSSLDSGCCAA
jgi:hypothetical protein